MRIPRRRLRQSGNNHCSPDTVLYKDLQENLTRIKTDFGQNDDLGVNCSERTASSSLTAACIYIDTLVDKNTVNHLSEELMTIKAARIRKRIIFYINSQALFKHPRSKTGAKFIDLYAELLSEIRFLANGNTEYLSIPTESKDSWPLRSRLLKRLFEARKKASVKGSIRIFSL